MGPLNDGLVQIGFNRPELFRVILNNRAEKPQAAVVSVTHAFEYPPLHGLVNPIDGQLYIAGFQIPGWGTTATRLAGLGPAIHRRTVDDSERCRGYGQGGAAAVRRSTRSREGVGC